MTKQTINVGATANDKQGDSLRAAFQKVNANFTELYTALGLADDTTLSLGAFEFTGSTMSTTDSTAIVIDQAVTVNSNLTVGGDLLPQTANGSDLGSSSNPWRSLYVSNNTIYIGGTAVGVDANGNLTTGGTVVGSSPAWASITGKPTFATVATSGAYGDLSGRPTIPTLTSQLTNDSNFITTAVLANGLDVDIKGSVFADDSTMVIDGTDGSVYANKLRTTETKTAIGLWAGQTNQGGGGIAIGVLAGSSNQGLRGIGIGDQAGGQDQGSYAIGIGYSAGYVTQGENAIAIGMNAGTFMQGRDAVAIGASAGGSFQGANSVAIGSNSNAQGANTIAIGNFAGFFGDTANRIMLNASGSGFGAYTSGFFVNPIRNVNGGQFLTYNTDTKEIGYSDSINGDLRGSVFADDSSIMVDAVSNSIYASTGSINDFSTQRVILSNDGEVRASSISYDAALSAWETIRSGEIQHIIDLGNATAQGWPMVNWHPTGLTAQGYLDFLLNAWTIQNQPDHQPLIIFPPISSSFYQAMRTSLTAIRDSYTSIGLGVSIAAGPATWPEINKSWHFGEDGTLTLAGDLNIPGDIKSNGNINIDINLADSTLRRWQFGEDGVLNVPGDVVQNGSPGLTLGASHNVYIVGDRGDNNRTWTFDGTSGDTVLPNGTVIADDGNDGIEVIMPTTTGTSNSFSWRFSDNLVGTDTVTLNWNLLASNSDTFYLGTTQNTNAKYLILEGSSQSLSYFSGGVPTNSKIIFGSPAGNNAGDANAIELKAADGDVYVTSTESVKITVDANDSSARVWTFDPSGNLNVPGGIVAEYEEDFTISTSYYVLGSPPGPGTKTFTFAANGDLTVPRIINATEDLVISGGDYSGTRIQAGVDGIIYIGYGGNGPHDIFIGTNTGGKRIVLSNDRLQILAAAPASSKGSSGDYAGMVAFNGDYIFYCINAYDGTTDIWKRVALTGGVW